MSSNLSSLRLGFAGTPEFAVAALDALSATRHPIAAVFTQPDRPAGRGQALRQSAVKQRALELGLEILQPVSFKSAEALDCLRGLNLDALVVVAYGLILPQAVLDVPRLGCFNIHASLLPRWRGAAPIQRALLAGDALTGVTIMRMEAGLDTGPMLSTRRTAIADEDTAGGLHDRLARLGGSLMRETLDSLSAGPVPQTPQPAEGVTYAEKIHKAEARIDWHEDAVQIGRRVRAFNPWPIAETELGGKQLRMWEAQSLEWPSAAAPAAGTGNIVNPAPGTVLAAGEAGIDVACGRGALRIKKLQLAGRKALPAGEFIRAQSLSGARFGAA